MSSRVKAALVGISGYGLSYLDALLNGNRAAQEVELVAAVDPMAEQSRRVEDLRERRIPIYPSLPAMFKATPSIELVMLVTPIHLHAPQTCLALQQTGVSVLCEKPLAGSLADARRVLAAEQRAAPGQFVAIGYQWSFSQAVAALKNDIMTGALGRPLRLRTMVSFPRPLSYFKRNDWAGHLRTPAGEDVLDSPVNNATAHYLHNMLYLLGASREHSATPATVQAELYRANDIENYDTAAMRCFTGAGTQILFFTTHAAADLIGPRSIFEFERATVTFDANSGDAHAGQFVARFRDSDEIRVYGNPNSDRHEKIWQSALAVRGGPRVPCGVAAAMAQTCCAVAAQRSMPRIVDFPRESVRRVDLGDDTMLAVPGLEDAVHRCFHAGVLPSELGELPWAAPARVVEVTGLIDGEAADRDPAGVAVRV
jgi:predicted dehydrogenase